MNKTGNLFLVKLGASMVFFVAISFFSIWVRQNKLGCQCFDFSGNIDYSQTEAIYSGKSVEIPKIAFENEPLKVLGVSNQEKWVEVDLSDQKLYAWDGQTKFLETLISSGLPLTPTPTGEFRIWIKIRATRMKGGIGKYAYNLPNVPYVMFFENSKVPAWKGYGLHGTYWHSDFGKPHSHGCINLPTEVAKTLYYWTTPVLPENKNIIRADSLNFGTRIVIHQ